MCADDSTSIAELRGRLAAAEERASAAERRIAELEHERRQAEEAAMLARRALLPPTPIGRPLADPGEQRLVAHIREQLAYVPPLSTESLDRLRRFGELFDLTVSKVTVQPGDYEAAAQWGELHALFRELSIVLFERLYAAGEQVEKARSSGEAVELVAQALGMAAGGAT